MNDHQKRLFKSMVELLDKYREEVVSFPYLVAGLEGLWDAAEVKDTALAKEWMNHWAPLEEWNAVYGNAAPRGKTLPDVKRMRLVLYQILGD